MMLAIFAVHTYHTTLDHPSLFREMMEDLSGVAGHATRPLTMQPKIGFKTDKPPF